MKLPKDLRSVAISAGILAGNVVLSYGISALLAHTLGLEGFGVYSVVIAAITALTIPAFFGLPALISREMATSLELGDLGLMRGLVIRSHQLIILASAIMIIGGTVWSLLSAAGQIYLLAMPLVLILSLAAARSAMLRGVGRVQAGQWPEQLLRPALLAGAVLAALGLGLTVTPTWAILATMAAAFVALLVNVAQWLATRPAGLSEAAPRYRDAAWLKAVLPFALSTGAMVLSAQIGLLMLGALADVEDVGRFRVAAQTAQLCALGYTAAVMNISPRLAAAWARQDRADLARTAQRGGLFAAVLSLPPALVMAIAGGPILGLLFGSAFAPAGSALAVLALGQVLNAAFGCGAALLNMTGHERDVTWGMSAGVVVQLLASLALIPLLGVLGAAVASVAGVTGSYAVLWWMARRRLGIDPAIWAALGRRHGV